MKPLQRASAHLLERQGDSHAEVFKQCLRRRELDNSENWQGCNDNCISFEPAERELNPCGLLTILPDNVRYDRCLC